VFEEEEEVKTFRVKNFCVDNPEEREELEELMTKCHTDNSGFKKIIQETHTDKSGHYYIALQWWEFKEDD